MSKNVRTRSEVWLPLIPAFLLPIFFYYFGRSEAYMVFFASQGAELSAAPVYYEWIFGILLFSLIPILTWTGILGYKLADMGFKPGMAKSLLTTFLPMLILLLVYAYAASRFEEFHLNYPRFKYIGMSAAPEIIQYYGLALVFFFARELFFRGFIVQSLLPQLGPAAAILISSMAAAPVFATVPVIQGTLGIVINLLFGLIAVRTGSFIHTALLSWIWMLALDWLIIYGI